MKRSSFLILMVVLVQVGMGQPTMNSIQVIAKPKNDGVWIRWAPSNPTIWQLGNKHGYVLERFTLNANGEIENHEGIKNSKKPFKPLSSSELMKLSSTLKEAEALNEVIYGEGDGPNSPTSVSQLLLKKEDLENRFGVALLLCDLSLPTAEAAGLFAVDKTAVKGQRYIYRIRLSQSTELDIKPGVIVIDVTEEESLASIKDLHAEFRDHTVMLSWPTLMHKGIYSLYNIERSTDGKTFKRITDMPYAHMTESPESETAYFIDSLDVNAKTYYYRIAGVTPFAEVGPTSNVVKGEGKNNLSGLLIIREGKIIEDKLTQTKSKNTKGNQTFEGFQVNLQWEFPKEEERQLYGFVISRASHADGPYQDVDELIDSKDRSYTDMTPFHNSYYQIRAIDKFKNEVAHSYPFLVQAEDNVPPQIPSALLGKINMSGVVTISWQDNVDKDLMGYRVFRSNSLIEEPVEVTNSILTQTEFMDTVNMNVLNKKIFYHIVAVDRNYNTSGYSSPLILSRPDKRPPTAPVFTKVEIVKDSILLEWNNSPSDDVAKYKLIRSEPGFSRTMITWTQASKRDLFYDRPEPGKTYQYRIEVLDSSGNSSQATTAKIIFETGFRKPVEDVKATVDREKRLVTLVWKSDNPAMKCMIYRKENDQPYKLYKTLEGDVSSFIDKMIAIGVVYGYKIQIVNLGGVRSILSSEALVKY